MTTGKKVLVVGAVLGVSWTIFYFAYWQGRNAVKPADIPVLASNTVAQGVGPAPSAIPGGSIASDITSALTSNNV
jgi:hypothetical protein